MESLMKVFLNQQHGTLNYNLGPVIFVNNGKSLAVADYDKRYPKNGLASFTNKNSKLK